MKWNQCFFLGFAVTVTPTRATDQLQYAVRKVLDPPIDLSLKLNSYDDQIHPEPADGYIKPQEYDFMSLSTQSSGRGKSLKTNEGFKIYYPKDHVEASESHHRNGFLDLSLANSHSESQMASNVQLEKRTRPQIDGSGNQSHPAARPGDESKSKPYGSFLKSSGHVSIQSRLEPLRPEEIYTAQDFVSRIGQDHGTSSVTRKIASVIPEPERKAVSKACNLRNNAPFETIEPYQPQFRAMPSKAQKAEEILDYCTEMANALKCIQEFSQYLESPREFKEVRKIWTEKLGPIPVHVREYKDQTMVWHLIEIWLEAENPTLWLKSKNANDSKLHNNLKRFINNIFFYGIEGLTKQAQKIIQTHHL
ncbi:hypothetical protein PtA15_8A245 [Puccinia triticina]|uniref:Ras-GEF domain-containing protein n=1 Tax=Puccinia triticina TaxID=208348 RepID=A0ABY7CT82_9BASI|nr:uncharacterized protein PtA15_8A245 [Puccinia triticina]WAQ87341.1 hypothetical protein PtA15_8A245 [Puccinia triticina]